MIAKSWIFGFIFVLLFIFGGVAQGIRLDNEDSEYDEDGGDQTYLSISQPDVNEPFLVSDYVPNSTVIYTIHYEHTDEVSIHVPGVANFRLSRYGHSEDERVDVFCNNRLRYRCHYQDSDHRESLILIILSLKAYRIAQSPQTICEIY